MVDSLSLYKTAVGENVRKQYKETVIVQIKATKCERKYMPWVKQQVVKAGLNETLTPSLILIRLIKLFAQSELISLTVRKQESVKRIFQFWAVTCS